MMKATVMENNEVEFNLNGIVSTRTVGDIEMFRLLSDYQAGRIQMFFEEETAISCVMVDEYDDEVEVTKETYIFNRFSETPTEMSMTTELLKTYKRLSSAMKYAMKSGLAIEIANC